MLHILFAILISMSASNITLNSSSEEKGFEVQETKVLMGSEDDHTGWGGP